MSREEQRMKRKKNSEDKLQFKGAKVAEGFRKGMRLFAEEYRKSSKDNKSSSSPGRYQDQPGERPMATERIPEKAPEKKSGGKKTPDLKSMTPEEREQVRLLMEAGIPYEEYMSMKNGNSGQSISAWKDEDNDIPKSNAEGKKRADADIAHENAPMKERKTKEAHSFAKLGDGVTTGSKSSSVPDNVLDAVKGERVGSNKENLPYYVKKPKGQNESQPGRPGGTYGAKKQSANSGTKASQYAIGADGKDVAPSGVVKRPTEARRIASSRPASVNNSSRQAIKGPNVQNGLREVLTEAFSHGYGGGTGNNTGASQNRQTDNRNLSGSKRDYLRRKGY